MHFPALFSLSMHIIMTVPIFPSFACIAISSFWYSLVAIFLSMNKIQIINLKAKRTLDVLTGTIISYPGGRLVFKRP